MSLLIVIESNIETTSALISEFEKETPEIESDGAEAATATTTTCATAVLDDVVDAAQVSSETQDQVECEPEEQQPPIVSDVESDPAEQDVQGRQQT